MLLGNETALLRVSHVLLGKIVGGYELGMEALSCRSWDAGVDWVMTRGSNQYFPISEVIVREPSNVCIRTVLHECILTICTSHAALSETRANQCLCRAPFESWFGYRMNPKNKAKYPMIQSLQYQLAPTLDVALLQDFSVWVRKAALLQFHYAAGKINPENKSLLVWNGFPVYCDNFLSDSCLAGCPKLTF